MVCRCVDGGGMVCVCHVGNVHGPCMNQYDSVIIIIIIVT